MNCLRVYTATIFSLLWCSSVFGGDIRLFDGSGPMELHVRLTAKTGQAADLEKAFRGVFYPAISKQKGFRHSNLLSLPDRDGEYVLTISFESENMRVRWVNTQLHDSAWSEFAGRYAIESKMTMEVFGAIAVK